MTGGRLASFSLASFSLASAGLLILIGSIVWWWASYGEVYAYNYLTLRQAGFCLVGENEICRLATSLCRNRHPVFVVAYSSNALWLGLSFFFISLILPGRGTAPTRLDP